MHELDPKIPFVRALKHDSIQVVANFKVRHGFQSCNFCRSINHGFENTLGPIRLEVSA